MKCSSQIQKLLVHFTLILLRLSLFLHLSVSAQEMNTDVSGVVKSESNHLLKSATVTIIHEPTQNKFYTQTNSQGYFHFFNVKPGGPYTIKITYSGYEPITRTNLFLSYSATNFYSYLKENELSEFILERRNDVLDEVQVKTKKRPSFKYGSETNITQEKMNSLPSVKI